MASNEKYCLRWNDFETNISTAFRELRDEKDFFDVTLACDDNQVQAHKVILSACSPFFRTVLRRNPHQHPLLYLRGVKYNELVNVLNFMYQGEVNVAQEELNDFLGVAEDLRVKGLTQGNKQNGEKAAKSERQERSSSSKESHIDSGPPPKRKRPSPSPAPHPPPPAPRVSESYHHQDDDDDIQEVVPIVKTEPMAMAITQSVVADPIQDSSGQEMALQGHYEESYDGFQYEDGGDQTYDESQMMDASMGDGTVEGNKASVIPGVDLDCQVHAFIIRVPPDGLGPLNGGRRAGRSSLQCSACNKTYETKHLQALQNHIEINHMVGVSYPCQLCNHVCSARLSLRAHIRKTHPEHHESLVSDSKNHYLLKHQMNF